MPFNEMRTFGRLARWIWVCAATALALGEDFTRNTARWIWLMSLQYFAEKNYSAANTIINDYPLFSLRIEMLENPYKDFFHSSAFNPQILNTNTFSAMIMITYYCWALANITIQLKIHIFMLLITFGIASPGLPWSTRAPKRIRKYSRNRLIYNLWNISHKYILYRENERKY